MGDRPAGVKPPLFSKTPIAEDRAVTLAARNCSDLGTDTVEGKGDFGALGVTAGLGVGLAARAARSHTYTQERRALRDEVVSYPPPPIGLLFGKCSKAHSETLSAAALVTSPTSAARAVTTVNAPGGSTRKVGLDFGGPVSSSAVTSMASLPRFRGAGFPPDNVAGKGDGVLAVMQNRSTEQQCCGTAAHVTARGTNTACGALLSE